MTLLARAVSKYRRDGLRELFATSLEYSAQSIREPSLVDRKRTVVDSYDQDEFFLNVGGGQFVRDDWRVLDYYSDWYDYDEVFIDFNVDLESLERWPIETNSVDLIFTGHTLEHLSDPAITQTLEECGRVLAPEGGLRINVPDIDIAIRHYQRGNVEWFTEFRPNVPPSDLHTSRHGQEEYVMEEYLMSVFATHLTNARVDSTSDEHCVDFKSVREDWHSLGKDAFLNKYSDRVKDDWQREKPGLHRNWFDYNRLADALSEIGFENVRRECSQQSRFTEFCHDIFGKRPYLGLHVEAIR